MNVSRTLLIVCALSLVAAFPYKAFSHKHIPFYVTYPEKDGAEDLYIWCNGPWVRSTGPIKIRPGDTTDRFYSAEVDIFSPYGEWTCRTYATCMLGPTGSPGCSDKKAEAKFHLSKKDDEVSLTMTRDSLSADLSNEDTTIATRATLGDDKSRRRRDRDTFSFRGTEGDTVSITLEPDPAAGHIGEQATLTLRKAGNGRSVIESSTGTLPVQIMTTLPASGDYELVVGQRKIAKDTRFRGSYFLSIESASGGIHEIQPTLDVEQ